MRSNSCPKCQGSMAEGFVLTDKHGWPAILAWHQGAPKRSMWTGFKLSGKPIETRTWRCNRCGFLEHYAPG